MNFNFWKMHGAGNDFVLLDDRDLSFPAAEREWLCSIAQRRNGIGCEGVILIQPSDKADFRMRFYNPDGGEVEMCGNGARCVARLASELGVAPVTMSIDTVAGVLRADVDGDDVCLHMTLPIDWTPALSLQLAEGPVTVSSLNTGVPHVVRFLDSEEALAALDVRRAGSEVRYHSQFAPAGTNANYVAILDATTIRVRTYERGVEAETMACGTGITAAALAAMQQGLVTGPVRVHAASGDVLTVDGRLTDEGADAVTLRGPAVHVYRGVIAHPGA